MSFKGLLWIYDFFFSDLCNNPLTKESKLDAARRIVSEWTDYDDEMQRLASEFDAEAKTKTISKSKESDSKVEENSHSDQHIEL